MHRFRRILMSAAPFLVLIALLIALRIAVGPSFLSHYNIHNILQQTLIVAVGAVGMTIIIVGGGIDLSCGSVIALCGMVTAYILRTEGVPIWLAMPGAIGVGILAGMINGSLIAGVRLAPFIVTLGTMGIARGLAKMIGGNSTVNYQPSWIDALMDRPREPGPEDGWWLWLNLPTSGWMLIGLIIVVSVLLRQSTFGRRVYAIGSNEAAARLCGIRVGWNKMAMYALAGACFGLAGVFQTARLGQGDPTTAIGMELDIIAAVIVGGASLSGGVGTVMGSIIGAFMMSTLRNGANQLEMASYWEEILIGIVIVLAVALDRLRHRTRS